MEKNTKLIIGGLVALLVICSIWGSINSRKAQTLQHELDTVTAGMDAPEVEPATEAHEPEVAPAEDPRIKELEAQLAQLKTQKSTDGEKGEQLKKAHQELVQVRKANKRLEGQVVQQQAMIKQLKKALNQGKQLHVAATKEVEGLKNQIAKLSQEGAGVEEKIQALAASEAQAKEAAAKAQEAAAALEAELKTLKEAAAAAKEQEALAATEEKEMAAKLITEVEMAGAQIVGLEKIVEEKDALLAETSSELDRVKINMDVLLGKIADMRDSLQELEQERFELIQDLTAKNEQLAALQAQVEQVPVPQQ